MRGELAALLHQVGYQPPSGRDLWDSVILLNNVGAVPPNPDRPQDYVQRGFQMLLLGSRLEPTHFARFSPATDEAFTAECRLLDLLSSDSSIRRIIAPSRTAASEHLRVQVSPFLPSSRAFIITKRTRLSQWKESAGEVLDARDRLCERAIELDPTLVHPADDASLAELVEPSLRVIEGTPGIGFSIPLVREALQRVAPVPTSLQHGDFWPGNLLYHRGRWRIIDFEDFGRVNVPLIDELHLIQSAARTGRWGPTGDWLDVGPFPVDTAWRVEWGGLLRARATAHGLTPDQIGGLITFYVASLCAHRMRPGVPEAFSVRPLSDLRAIAGELTRDARLADLIPGRNGVSRR